MRRVISLPATTAIVCARIVSELLLPAQRKTKMTAITYDCRLIYYFLSGANIRVLETIFYHFLPALTAWFNDWVLAIFAQITPHGF